MPGLLASTAVQVAIGGSTWPVFGGFEWMKTYFAQAAAPLRVGDILARPPALLLFRVLRAPARRSSLVARRLRHPALALGAGRAAGRGAASAWPCPRRCRATPRACSSDSYLAMLCRFAVIPMTLFAGVFFPVASLPPVLRWLAYASPLWHAVDLCRAATLGRTPEWPVAGHLLYLAAWAVVGWWLARAAFPAGSWSRKEASWSRCSLPRLRRLAAAPRRVAAR